MRIKLYFAVTLTGIVLAVTVALAQHPAGHGEMQKKEQHAKMNEAPYDLRYIDMMMHHHQMGIDMAKLAQNKASHAELKTFATKTIEEQQKDSDQLKKWRDEWYADKPIFEHMNMQGMDMSKMCKSDQAHMHNLPGMQQMDMRKLEAATGNEFDLLFLDMLIPHHQMAIDMSQEASKKAAHAQLKTFARTNIAKQQKEKAQMTKWRSAWSGK
jgi:uncharacterized protein (DUF305 family)